MLAPMCVVVRLSSIHDDRSVLIMHPSGHGRGSVVHALWCLYLSAHLTDGVSLGPGWRRLERRPREPVPVVRTAGSSGEAGGAAAQRHRDPE